MPEPLTAVVILTFLLAGLVKGVIGLGLPTVAVGMLSLAMAPAQAAALMVVPSLATNLWQALVGGHFGALARRLWPLLLGIVLGTAAGTGQLTGDHAGRASMLLGLALAVYAVLGLSPLRLAVPPRHEIWLGALMGGLTGLVTAATGVFVIPAVPYLQALALDRDALVQALGLSFTVSTAALAAVLAWDGAFRLDVAAESLVALVPALAGMASGQWVRGRIGARAFRICFFVGLFGLGAHLALRGLV